MQTEWQCRPPDQTTPQERSDVCPDLSARTLRKITVSAVQSVTAKLRTL